MAAREKENIWNVPNALTMLRMALIPVFWVFMMKEQDHAALITFVIASLTDAADGYIARKYNLITSFGKLMDPLADKLMVLSMMLSLAIRGIVPWAVVVIVLLKEAVMVAGGSILYKHQVVVYSRMCGKIAQVVMVIALISCFFHNWLKSNLGFPLHLCLLWLGVALTLLALGIYMVWAIRMYRDLKTKGQSTN